MQMGQDYVSHNTRQRFFRSCMQRTAEACNLWKYRELRRDLLWPLDERRIACFPMYDYHYVCDIEIYQCTFPA